MLLGFQVYSAPGALGYAVHLASGCRNVRVSAIFIEKLEEPNLSVVCFHLCRNSWVAGGAMYI